MSNGIYDILGKLASLTPKEEPKKATTQKIYESVEAKGSILEGVEAKLSEKYMGFKAVEKSAKKGGAENPAAVAASIGRKKYGKEKFQKAAAASKKMGEDIASIGTGGMGSMGVVGEEHEDWYDANGRPSPNGAYDAAGHFYRERNVDESAAPGQEGWIKKNKARFIDQYGEKKGLEVLYATAWKRSKKDESIEESDFGWDHKEKDEPKSRKITGKYGTEYQGDADDEEEQQKAADTGKRTRGRPRKHAVKAPKLSATGEKLGRGRPKKAGSTFNAGGLAAALGMGAAPKKHSKGRVHRMDESRMIDEAGEALEHILTRYATEVRQFERGGELDNELYDSLFDYYSAVGEMPYGIQKARTGDPYEWVTQQLDNYLVSQGAKQWEPEEGIKEMGIGSVAAAPVPSLEEEIAELTELAKLAGVAVPAAPAAPIVAEDEVSSESQNLMKLAKVIKGVNTPEQYAAAKKYAKLMWNKLKMPYYGSFVPKHMRAINNLFNSIEADLKAKRRELGIAGPGRNDFEMDEAAVNVGNPETLPINSPNEKYISMKASTLNPGEGDAGEKQMNPDRPTFKNGDNALSRPPVRENSLDKLMSEYESIKKVSK